MGKDEENTKKDEVVEETEEQENPEEEQEEEQEETEEVEDEKEISKEDLALIKLLKDPRTQKAALSALVEQAGMKIAAGVETKKEAKTSSLEVLKTALGPDWAFLAEKLEPGLKQLIDDKVNELRGDFETNQQRQMLRESQEATERLYKKYPDMQRLESDIMSLMEKFPPSENLPPYEYLESLYIMAKGRRSQGSIANKVAQRIKQNSRESGITSSITDETKLRVGSKHPTIDEAINMAITQLRNKK